MRWNHAIFPLIAVLAAPSAAAVRVDLLDTAATDARRGFPDPEERSPPLRGLAAYTDTSASVVGTVRITLPKLWSTAMVKIRIRGHETGSKTSSWELLIAGYNYLSGWVSSSVTLQGEAPFHTVRLATNGSHNVILLGTSTTTWSRPAIAVSELSTSHGSLYGWGSGWSIGAITDESGMTSASTKEIHLLASSR